MQRVIERLPFSLRQRWCDVADDITNNKHREITFEDIASFVESKARAFNHPVYGAINTERRNQGKTSNDRRPRRSDNFATQGGEPISENNENRPDITKATPKCHLCKEDHWLTRKDSARTASSQVIKCNPVRRTVIARSPLAVRNTRRFSIQNHQIATLGTPPPTKALLMKVTEERLGTTITVPTMLTSTAPVNVL